MPSHSLNILTKLVPPVPLAMARRAETWTPDQPVVSPTRAASVILLRERNDGLETYLLHRHARMAFAASTVVFPGGKVDPIDEEPGQDPLRACAVRETEEETGVALQPGDLKGWAHWITPQVEPRRYDTWFFVARLPEGQDAQDLSGETDRAGWEHPSAAVETAEGGEIALMPPTLSILVELAEAETLAGVLRLAEGRIVAPVLPVLVRQRSGWAFRYPRPDDHD